MAIISASILSADFAHLYRDVQAVLDAGADAIHFDVMDGHYVPNLSVGALVCRSLRDAGISAEIDVHLMVDNPVPSLYSLLKPSPVSDSFILNSSPLLII